MVANDDFDGKATHLNSFYMHMIFEQKYPKPALVVMQQHWSEEEGKKLGLTTLCVSSQLSSNNFQFPLLLSSRSFYS